MIIIGTGLTGSTAARILADSGYNVTVIEKNNEPGGTAYDYVNNNGILVHKHGPHIFHTNSDEVFRFISRFGEWNSYKHKVKAVINNKFCPIPFNYKSIDLCFGDKAELFKNKLALVCGDEGTITIGKLMQTNDSDLKQLAEFVYENVFLHYTEKQWGMSPDKLGGNVMERVPVRASYEEGYFKDKYQLMPKDGYTKFILNLLSHENIKTVFETDADNFIAFDKNKALFKGEGDDVNIIYTGCIDKLLKYKFGPLPYRSLKFKLKEAEWKFQPEAVINYPNEHEYTRITEFGHFYNKDYLSSTLLYEYPQAYDISTNDNPYYPVPSDENYALYEKYTSLISSVQNFHLAGRLGRYKYINMDDAILQGINTANYILQTDKTK